MMLAKKMGVKSLMEKSDSLTDVSYLKYVQILKETFAVFELVHVPIEQNARADLLAKLASSGKGGRQRIVIQETLRTPWTTTNCTTEVHQISTSKGVKRSHRSLTQETLKTPKISVVPTSPRTWALTKVMVGPRRLGPLGGWEDGPVSREARGWGYSRRGNIKAGRGGLGPR